MKSIVILVRVHVHVCACVRVCVCGVQSSCHLIFKVMGKIHMKPRTGVVKYEGPLTYKAKWFPGAARGHVIRWPKATTVDHLRAERLHPEPDEIQLFTLHQICTHTLNT